MSTAHKRKPLHKNGAWGQRKTALPAWRPCEKDHGSHHTSLRLTPVHVSLATTLPLSIDPQTETRGSRGRLPGTLLPPCLFSLSPSLLLPGGDTGDSPCHCAAQPGAGKGGAGGWKPGFTHSNAAVSPPTGPLPDCAYLGVSLDSPGPRFPCLSSGEGDITHPVGLWWGVDGSGCGASLAGTRRALQNQVPAGPTANSG